MYVYVPSTSATAHPAIVVALHGCGGTGPGFYSSSEFASLADRYGFIVIFPSAEQQAGFGNCWDTWSAAAKVRGGGSDPVSLVSMITYTEQHYGGDGEPRVRHRLFLRRNDDRRDAGPLPGRVQGRGRVHGSAVRLLRQRGRLPAGQQQVHRRQHDAHRAGMGRRGTGGRSRIQRAASADSAVARHRGHSGAVSAAARRHQAMDQRVRTQSDPDVHGYAGVGLDALCGTPMRQGRSTSRPTAFRAPVTPLPSTGMAAYAIHFFGLDGSGGGSPSPTPTASSSPSPSASPSASPVT